MRIAVVHSFYSSRVPSGENQVVLAQVEALRAAGHEVALVARHTDDRLRRASYPVEAALTTATGVGPDPTAELAAFRPDVVHVHNLFPNFGTAWLRDWPGRIVATLHNFRPMCANGYLFRDGAPCTACPSGDRWAAVKHGCFHGSRVASLPLAFRGRHGAPADPLLARADALVVLSERARRTYRDAGVDRLHVVPNFVTVTPAAAVAPGDRWLCVARLTPEKGVLELVRSWPAGVGLDVVGEGELRPAIESAAPDGVRLLGSMDNAALRAAMGGYAGLVVPSRWFEGLPTVYLEALAAGLPVLAVDGNSAADDVAAHDLGVVVPTSFGTADLRAALAAVADRGADLRRRAGASFRDRFTAPTWCDTITGVYDGTGVRARVVEPLSA
ncbi:glycosyltransferase family 4 protein [Actinomycetospora aeridis]|uniref:Glycosyltransferase family 4 protein n=1 Tax=Actinomycetospora aeridis TaxID=3129231 RepID=A0ABU8N655_9PSEU